MILLKNQAKIQLMPALRCLLLAALVLVYTGCNRSKNLSVSQKANATEQTITTNPNVISSEQLALLKKEWKTEFLKDQEEKQALFEEQDADIVKHLMMKIKPGYDLFLYGKTNYEALEFDIFFLYNKLKKIAPEEARKFTRWLTPSRKTEKNLRKILDELLEKVGYTPEEQEYVKGILDGLEGDFVEENLAKLKLIRFTRFDEVEEILKKAYKYIINIEEKFSLKNEIAFGKFFAKQFIQPLTTYYGVESVLKDNKESLEKLKKDNVVDTEKVRDLESQIKTQENLLAKKKANFFATPDKIDGTRSDRVRALRLRALGDTRPMYKEWESKRKEYLKLLEQYEELKVDLFAVYNSRIPKKKERKDTYKVQLLQSKKLRDDLETFEEEIKNLRDKGIENLFSLNGKKEKKWWKWWK